MLRADKFHGKRDENDIDGCLTIIGFENPKSVITPTSISAEP